MSIIEVRGLSKTFSTKENTVEALRDIELDIEAGEDGHIYMTGPATTVFEGEIEL